jgi:hypothetical protein
MDGSVPTVRCGARNDRKLANDHFGSKTDLSSECLQWLGSGPKARNTAVLTRRMPSYFRHEVGLLLRIEPRVLPI